MAVWRQVFILLLSLFAGRIASEVSPRYRISPIDGSKIALPTPELLAWQAKELAMIIHFNIASYLNQSFDGCNNHPHLVPSVQLFDPVKLNTDQWATAIDSFGAKYATLVAKHNCGFATWPSKVRFNNAQGKEQGYNYTIADSPVHGEDVPAMFVKSMDEHNLGHGFYYSVNFNDFLGVSSGQIPGGSGFAPGTVQPTLGPGQVNITQATYNQVVLDQLTELWTNYGKLTEIWFDGGYSADQQNELQKLIEAHQPQAVIFNGCTTNGSCVSANSVRWIGTESGAAPNETWSTGVTNDGGDPSSPIFAPALADTPLQVNDKWFYKNNSFSSLRSLEDMKTIYHESVGRNCVLELDLAPDPSGLVPDNQMQRLKELGGFIRSCYGKPAAVGTVDTSETGVYRIQYAKPVEIDRVQMMEDQSTGQLIRSWNVHARLASGSQQWQLLAEGKSIGNKRISLLDKKYSITELLVNATQYADVPCWKDVSVHLCE